MIDFEWKNEKASEHGIIVVSLPPISKAMQRNETIEIDGRDGDIIIEKGFKAYDKQVQIGLARNYDLNWLINWLNGSGKVIFSNEEEFFYEAMIVGQIDFKKLLSFKTSTITFHVQPYKYSIHDAVIDKSFSQSDTKKMNVQNIGFLSSKPVMTVYGKGKIDISINGHQVCILDLDEQKEDHITLDSMNEDAYTDNSVVLRNRSMTGEFPIFESGWNEITWTGNVTRIQIQVKSRWL